MGYPGPADEEEGVPAGLYGRERDAGGMVRDPVLEAKGVPGHPSFLPIG